MTERNEKWLVNLIAALDEHVDEKTRIRILEQCGRHCQSPVFIKKAKDLYAKSKSVVDFVERLSVVYKHLHLDGGNVYIIYPKCYCPRVNTIPQGKLSGTYCYCSVGWAKALFEGALERPVEVVKESSIIGGDRQCKFRIIL